MDVGQSIGISIGHATAHCSVAVAFIHGDITATTEKAVKVTLHREGDFRDGASVWFPKKALRKVQHHPSDTPYFELARWFKPNDYTARAIERHTHMSSVSA